MKSDGDEENREKVTGYTPRQLKLSGRQWFRSVTTTSLSRWKRMVVVLLGDLLVVVKGGMGVVRHNEAPQLVG
jgi:hypothetical protein